MSAVKVIVVVVLLIILLPVALALIGVAISFLSFLVEVAIVVGVAALVWRFVVKR